MNQKASLTVICITLAAVMHAPLVQAATADLLTPTLRPGQTVIASFDNAPQSVTFDSKVITAFPYQHSWRVVIPLPLSAKTGSHTLETTFGNDITTRTITVIAGRSKVINLPVPEKLNQTPAQLVQNLKTTNVSIQDFVKAITAPHFSVGFGLPLFDNRKISSPFGEVRKTGQERITHLGTDFAGKIGAYVAAINTGVVAKAYVDPVYGNSVIVDHGQGIYSLYLHMDTITVKTGDAVKKGAQIGTLGQSGLASAPHLHLSIKINGQSVDPLQFVAAFR